MSKAPVGSSQKITLGEEIKALAIATRCFSPPLNFLTYSFLSFSISSNFKTSLVFLSLNMT